MHARLLVPWLAALSLGLTPTADAQEPARSCWCFAWIHGPDSGNDCFAGEAICERARAERRSGDTTPCRHAELPACERAGDVGGQSYDLGPRRPTASQLMGRSLAQLREELGPPTSRDAGWYRFGRDVAVRLVRGRAARVRVRVRGAAGIDCRAVAQREGFVDASVPIRGRDACQWPGVSERHRLDREGRLAGRFELQTATLEIWQRVPPT